MIARWLRKLADRFDPPSSSSGPSEFGFVEATEAALSGLAAAKSGDGVFVYDSQAQSRSNHSIARELSISDTMIGLVVRGICWKE